MELTRWLPLVALPLVVFVGRFPALASRGRAPELSGQIFVGRDAADRCVAVLARPGDDSAPGEEPLATVYEGSEADLVSAEVSPTLRGDRGVEQRALDLLAEEVAKCQGERSRAPRDARAFRSTSRRPWGVLRRLRVPRAPHSPAASR